MLDNSCAVLDVVDNTAKNTLQVCSAVVPINNNRLQAVLDYMLVPKLVEKLALASHSKD